MVRFGTCQRTAASTARWRSIDRVIGVTATHLCTSKRCGAQDIASASPTITHRLVLSFRCDTADRQSRWTLFEQPESTFTDSATLDPVSLSRRQQEVLDALETAFLEDGFRKPTIGELAARAKCSRRTLYEIAPTKGEMFLVVLDRMMGRLDQGAREFVHSKADPASKLEALLASGVTLFRPAGAEFAADLSNYQPARMLFAKHTDRVRGSIVRIVREGIASGQLLDVDPDIVAEVMLIMTRHVSEPAYLARTGRTYSEAMSLLYDFLRHGFAVPEA